METTKPLERLVSFGGTIRTVGSLYQELGPHKAAQWLQGYDLTHRHSLQRKMLAEAHYLSLFEQAKEAAK